VFQEFYVRPFAYNQATSLPFFVYFKATTPTVATTEIVVQLQTYDYTYMAGLFTANPTYVPNASPASYSSGQAVDCSLYLAAVLQSGFTCLYYQGDGSGLFSATRNPHMFIIQWGTGISLNDEIRIALPPISNPTTAADVTVFTRQRAAVAPGTDSYVIMDYMVYSNAFQTTLDVAVSTSKAFPTLTGNDLKVQAVPAGGYTMILSSHSGADRLMVQFPAAYLPLGNTIASTAPAPTAAATYCLFKLGYCLVLPSASIAPGSSNLVMTNLKNVGYIPTTPAESVITVYTSYAYRLAVYPLSTTMPTWTAQAAAFDATMSFGAPGFGTLDGGKVYASWESYYQLKIAFASTVTPKGGAYTIEFPSGAYTSVSPYVTNSGGATCQGSGRLWQCTAAADISATTVITLTGRATTTSAVSGITNFYITAYADTAATRIIAQSKAAGAITFTAGARYSTPNDLSTPWQREFLDVPVKADENGLLMLVFTPSVLLPKAVTQLTIKEDSGLYLLNNGPTGSQAICKFTRLSNGISYRAVSCSCVSNTWTVTTPLNTDITAGESWQLTVYMTGTESQTGPVMLGVKFPTATVFRYRVKVTLGTGVAYEEMIYNVLAKPAKATLQAVNRQQSFAGTFYILKFDIPLPAFSAGGRISLLFPTKTGSVTAFDPKLGASSQGTDMGCGSDLTAAPNSSLLCRVTSAGFTYSQSRTMRFDLENFSSFAGSTLRTIAFGGVTNPAAEQVTWVGVQALDLSAGTKVAYYAKLQFAVQMIAVSGLISSTGLGAVLSNPGIEVSGVSAAITGISVQLGDYVTFQFSHTVANTAGIDGYTLVQVPLYNLILGQSTSVTPLNSLVLSGLTNPAYVPTSASLTLKVYSSGKYSSLQSAALSYTGKSATFSITSLSPTVAPGLLYSSASAQYSLTFTYSADVQTAAPGLVFTFASTVITSCQVVAWNEQQNSSGTGLAYLGEDLCIVNSNSFTVQLGTAYMTSGFGIRAGGNPGVYKVLFWANISASGTVGVTAELVMTSGQSKGPFTSNLSLTTTASALILAPCGFLTANPNTLVRADDQNQDLSFSFDIKKSVSQLITDAVLEPKVGYVAVSMPTAPVSFALVAPAEFRCVWVHSSGARYLASSCTLTDTLTVYAPPGTDIRESTWTVWLTTLMRTYSTGKEGIIYSATPSLSQITALHYARDSSSIVGYGRAAFEVPPKASDATLLSFGNAQSSPNALKFQMKLPAGATVNGGLGFDASSTMELVLSLNYKTYYSKLGSSVLYTSTNYGKTDCVYTGTSSPNTECYLMEGSATRSSEVWIRNFATPANDDGLILAPIFNPATSNVMCHATVRLRRWSGGVWVTEMVSEFKYLYASGTAVTETNGQSQTPASTVVQSVPPVTLSFAISLSNSPSNLNKGLALFQLTEASPTMSGITSATHTAYGMNIHRFLVVFASAVLTNPLSFSSTSIATAATTQTWSSWVYGNARCTYFKYTPTSFVAANSLVLVMSQVSARDSIVPAGVNLALRIQMVKNFPNNGQIAITMPTISGSPPAISSICLVEGANSGQYECVVASNVLFINKLNAYAGNSPALLIRTSIAVTSIVTPASVSFTATVYATPLVSTSAIETSAAVSLSISLPSVGSLKVYSLRPDRQDPACLGTVTDLVISLKPRAAYASLWSIQVTFPNTASLPGSPATTECYLTDMTNVVRGRTCTAVSAGGINTFTVGIPEMMSLSDVTKQYSLIVTYMANTGTSPAYTGMTLPTIAAARATSMPGAITALLSVYDASSVLKEQAKLYQGCCSGLDFTNLNIRLGTNCASATTFLDVSFSVSTTVPGNSLISLSFPTSTGLLASTAGNPPFGVFDVALGTGFTDGAALVCEAQTTFATTPVCTLRVASAVAVTSPAKVEISGHGGLTAGQTYRILIADLRTPTSSTDPIHIQPYSLSLKTTISLGTNTAGDFIYTGSLNAGERTDSQWPALGILATCTTATVTGTSAAVLSSPTLTFTMDGAGYSSITLDVNKGYLTFKLDAALVVPPLATALTCGGSLGSCGVLRIVAKNTLIVEKLTASASLLTSNTVTITPIAQPVYAKSGGYPIELYTTTNTGTISHFLTASVVSITAGTALTFALAQLPTTLLPQAYHLFTLTVTPSANSSKAVRIEIKFPSSLVAWLDPTCQVSGLAAGISGAISCVAEDCSTSSCVPHAQYVNIKNFVSPLPTSAITIKIAGKTTNFAALATGNWDATLYGQLTGTTSVLETKSSAATVTIGASAGFSPPYDQALDLVTDTPMDRLLQAGPRRPATPLYAGRWEGYS